MGVVDLFVLTSGFVFLLSLAGLHNYITNFEENGCEMTYMFEYPQYVKIFFPPNVSSRYSRYALYAYGEGQFTENLRKMKFNGIPVLFIPGNSGSYKQVRSLASVSLRMGIKSHMPYHFDYFSADLNEEYSGLYGGILEDQTEFIHHCIIKILNLYPPGPNSPNSVIIIGHSMGGLVAKGLFLLPYFDWSQIHVVITLATPHKAPVVLLDHHLASYHSKVKSYWLMNKNNETGALNRVTLVSIGGGQRDITVRSSLTVAEEADVCTVSTAIPAVWLSTDHLSTLWCKELVLVIVRALFDIVDVRSKQITHDAMERKHAFQYHLVKRTAGKRLGLAFHAQSVTFDPNGDWQEYLRRQFTIMEPNGIAKVTYLMIRLIDDPKHKWLTAEVINLQANDWVFACSANTIYGSSRICDSGINISNQTKFLPSSGPTASTSYKRKMVHIHLADYKQRGFSHVIIRLLPTREMIQLNIDIHSSARNLHPPLPYMVNFVKLNSVVENTEDSALYYSLSFPNFGYIWQAYYLHINPHSCRLAKHHAVGVMHVPWNQEDLFVKVSELVEKPMQLRLQMPRPPSWSGNESVEVQLILDPSCKYSLSIQSAFLDSLGQTIRFYVPMLLSYVTAVLILTLRSQVLNLANSQTCAMFHSAITSGAKPYYILPLVIIASQVLRIGVIAKFFKQLLSQLDPLTIVEENLDFLLLPVFLYMTAFAVTYIAALAFWFLIIFNGSAANKLALRFLANTVAGTVTWSEWVLSSLSSLPMIAASILIGLTFTTCGALSLCVGGVFYFLKLCKKYEDYLQDVFKYSIYLIAKKMPKKRKDKDVKKPEEPENKIVKNKSIELKEDNPTSSKTDETKDNSHTSSETDETKENDVAKEKSETEESKDADKEHEKKEDSEPNSSKEVCVQKHINIERPNGEESANKENDATKTDSNDTNNPQQQAENKEHRCPELGDLSVLHFNFTLLLLWIIVTVINVPAVLVWAHNYRFSSKLDPDSSFETSIVLNFCIGILWQKESPKPNLKYYSLVGCLLYAIAVVTLIFSSLSVHYLNPLLMLVFIIITFHQLFSGQTPSLEDSSSIPNEESKSSKTAVKIKQC